MKITLKEYARRIGKDPSTIRHKILAGGLPGEKVGRDWLIEESTPYVDLRKKGQKSQPEEPKIH